MNPWGGIMAGAGQAVIAFDDYRTSKKVEKAIGDSIAERSYYQDQLDEMLMGQIGDLRGMTPEDERQEAMGQFVSRLREARAPQAVATGARGAVSEREAAALKGATADLGQFAGREADVTARLDSQDRMRQNQDRGISRLGGRMRLQGNKMSSRDFLNELRIKRKSRGNRWMQMLGEGMKAAGGAMSGGMGGGGGGSAPIGQSASANFDPSIYG